jgi:hypothetical protein
MFQKENLGCPCSTLTPRIPNLRHQRSRFGQAFLLRGLIIHFFRTRRGLGFFSSKADLKNLYHKLSKKKYSFFSLSKEN